MVTPAKMAMLARLHITAIEPERVLAQAASQARLPRAGAKRGAISSRREATWSLPHRSIPVKDPVSSYGQPHQPTVEIVRIDGVGADGSTRGEVRLQSADRGGATLAVHLHSRVLRYRPSRRPELVVGSVHSMRRTADSANAADRCAGVPDAGSSVFLEERTGSLSFRWWSGSGPASPIRLGLHL